MFEKYNVSEPKMQKLIRKAIKLIAKRKKTDGEWDDIRPVLRDTFPEVGDYVIISDAGEIEFLRHSRRKKARRLDAKKVAKWFEDHGYGEIPPELYSGGDGFDDLFTI